MKKQIALAVLVAIVTQACQTTNPDAHECEIATWNDFATAAVSYTFDDNLPNQFLIAAPMLEHYGFVGSFYPVAKEVDNWDVLSHYSSMGHEIGSHTYSHLALSSLTLDSLNFELQKSKELILQNVPRTDCCTMVYPYCDKPDTALVAQHYIAARICDERIETSTPANYYAISSFIVGSESAKYKTAQSIINLFNDAKQTNGWCVILVHEIEDGYGYSPLPTAAFDSTLQFLDKNQPDFWVDTFGNVVKYTKERDNASIKLIESTDEHIILSLTSPLDECIYNVPLSIRRPLPAEWTDIVVRQNSVDTDFCIIDNYIYFNAIPNEGEIIIRRL